MRFTSGLVLSTVLGTLAMFGGEVHAWEGRTFIHNISSGGPPYVITRPGHYLLTRNITITSGRAIIIDSDCVHLDLNGKSIENTNPSPVFGDNLIEIEDTRTDVTILNGWLTGGYRGINYIRSIPPGLQARIRNVQIRGAVDRGISIHRAGNVELVSNQVHEIGGQYGIYVIGDGPSFTGRFVENTVEDVAGWGIYLQDFEGGQVIRNVVRRYDGVGSGTAGIELAGTPPFFGGNIIKENTISFGNGDAIKVETSQNNLIKDNVITANAGVGLFVGNSEGNTIRNNTIGRNVDGILVNSVGDRNLIDGNHLESNLGTGILFFGGLTANNVCRDNTLQNNAPDWSGSAQISLGTNLPAGLCN